MLVHSSNSIAMADTLQSEKFAFVRSQTGSEIDVFASLGNLERSQNWGSSLVSSGLTGGGKTELTR